MCGIAGLMDLAKDKGGEQLSALVSAMSDAISHRGPDGEGIWADPATGLAFGHRRLAIIDLSESGHQPMTSARGRFTITYNGEIYNFRTLRPRLEEQGYRFKGTSDTEVLLAAVELWGLERALQEIDGMFAFALYDREERVLHLARDRMGKKPLYYGWMGNVFLFGSELKALRAHPDFKAEIDRNALATYVRHNCIAAPWSIYKGVYKLPPASYLTLPLDRRADSKPETYWNVRQVAIEGTRQPLDLPFDEMLDQLNDILEDAVVKRMVSDVPLGAFLSGGIDSSLVTAIMQKNSTKPVKTFCIGFEESGYNEAPHARQIADHLGTDHTEYYVTAEEARNVIPDLPKIFDEPFGDSSQIPTYHVSRLARQEVTVALSGDGGDEGFAGYSRYYKAQKAAGLLWLPKELRSVLSAGLGSLPLSSMQKLSEVLTSSDRTELYRRVMSYWRNPYGLLRDGEALPKAMNDDVSHVPSLANFIDVMMYMDMTGYLPDDILAKVDRCSMAVSLESRAPLLDYKVIEFAWRIPLAMKIRNGEGKEPLKALLERHMPREMFARPKQGFGIPHGAWIKGPLLEWAESLLDEKRLEQEGFFNPAPIRKKWHEHLSGRYDWSYALWGILMFQAWHEHWRAE